MAHSPAANGDGSSFPCEVRKVDDAVGSGLFATANIPGPPLDSGRRLSHTVVLQERPVVFAPAFSHWGTHDRGAPSTLLRSCFGCGAALATLGDEVSRVAAAVDGASVERCLAVLERGLPPESVARHFRGAEPLRRLLGVSAAGEPLWVFYCSPACEETRGRQEGKHLVIAGDTEPGSVMPDHPLLDAAAVASAVPLRSLRFPTADVVACTHHCLASLPAAQVRAVWPTRACVLSTLLHAAALCNERAWLLVLLLARLAATDGLLERGAGAEDVVGGLAAAVERVIGSYAEGAMNALSAAQRAFLLFSWRLVLRWLTLCITGGPSTDGRSTENVEAEAEEERVTKLLEVAFPAQAYLQLYWLTNANAHMYIVASPLYALWCDYFEKLSEGPGTEGAEEREAVEMLYSMFAQLSVCHQERKEDFMHSTVHVIGCALYDIATKINHSCAPNVRFYPNMIGGVCADVRALRDIYAGEQLLTSYIDISAFESDGDAADSFATRERRMAYLERGYGFRCTCPLCLSPPKQ